MNHTAKLLLWASSAALTMFAVYAWLPEWTTATGVLIGYLCVLIVEKYVPSKGVTKDAYLFGLFGFTTIVSYLILLLACNFLPNMNQCGERAKTSLVLSNLFFVGAPILVLYIFVWVPRHFRNRLQK